MKKIFLSVYLFKIKAHSLFNYLQAHIPLCATHLKSPWLGDP